LLGERRTEREVLEACEACKRLEREHARYVAAGERPLDGIHRVPRHYGVAEYGAERDVCDRQVAAEKSHRRQLGLQIAEHARDVLTKRLVDYVLVGRLAPHVRIDCDFVP
jgi:hypothetical protein